MYKNAYKITKQVIFENRLLLVFLFLIYLSTQLLLFLIPYLLKIQIEILEHKADYSLFHGDKLSLFILIIFVLLVADILKRFVTGIKGVISAKANGCFAFSTERIIFNKLNSLDIGLLSTLKNNKLIYLFFDLSDLPYNLLNFILTIFFTISTIFGLIPVLFHFSGIKILLIIIVAEVIRLTIIKGLVSEQSNISIYTPSKLSRIKEIIFLFKYKMDSVIKINGGERVFEEYQRGRFEQLDLKILQTRFSNKYDLFFSILEHVSSFVIVLLLGALVLKGDLTIGIFSMSVMYVKTIQSNMSLISSFYTKWYAFKIKLIQMEFFLNLKEEQVKVDMLDDINEGVGFRNVNFSYPGMYETEVEYLKDLMEKIKLAKQKGKLDKKDNLIAYFEEVLQKNKAVPEKVLKGIDAEFRSGLIHAIVGKNGAGKTTLVNLITKDYCPTSGEITIDKCSTTDISSKNIRSICSNIGQTNMILESISIRDNLLLGVEKDLSDDTILKTLGDIGFKTDLINSDFLNKRVGEDIQLSDGQLQLLAISRVILQDRSIVIFDEGTGRLDAIHEHRIIDLLRNVKKDKVIIFITHRMTTARKADLIHVIDDGRIVDTGNHDELIMKSTSLYHEFWKKQLG